MPPQEISYLLSAEEKHNIGLEIMIYKEGLRKYFSI